MKSEAKDYSSMTRREFEALPPLYNVIDTPTVEIDSLIILPTRRTHDSGYRIMDMVAIRDSKPLGRLNGYTDVLHLGGTAGRNGRTGRLGVTIPVGWSVDCLPVSGLVRIFCDTHLIIERTALSTFDVLYKETVLTHIKTFLDPDTDFNIREAQELLDKLNQ